MLSFSQWKTKTLLTLIKIVEENDNEKLRHDVNTLIVKLEYLKARDLSRWLRDLWFIANYHANIRKNLLALVPSEEQITYWFSREE